MHWKENYRSASTRSMSYASQVSTIDFLEYSKRQGRHHRTTRRTNQQSKGFFSNDDCAERAVSQNSSPQSWVPDINHNTSLRDCSDEKLNSSVDYHWQRKRKVKVRQNSKKLHMPSFQCVRKLYQQLTNKVKVIFMLTFIRV